GPGQTVTGQRLAEAGEPGLLVGGAHQAVHVGVAVPQQVEQHVAAQEPGGSGEQQAAGRQRFGVRRERQAVGEREIGEDLVQHLGAGPGGGPAQGGGGAGRRGRGGGGGGVGGGGFGGGGVWRGGVWGGGGGRGGRWWGGVVRAG